MTTTQNIIGSRILAENVFRSNDTWKTGLNNNDLIIGGSGSGKTRGYVIPNILQANNSMIIADTKGNLYYKFKDYLKEKGYKVFLLDFKNLYSTDQCGYNPLHYIKYDETYSQYNEQDIIKIANILSPVETAKDPFWEKSAKNYIAILISYILETESKENHTLNKVFNLFNLLEHPKIEELFKNLAKKKPDCFASRNYNQILEAKKTDKTYNCIKMFISEKLQTLSTLVLNNLYNNKNMINIEAIGKEKTAVFLSIHDADRSLDTLVSLFYTQCFCKLIDIADKNPESRLDVPVSFILDDFATNCRIQDFDNLIAVIRSREIYASIILQNTSQLSAIYGSDKANTIINNCDNTLYLGGQDIMTADLISQKINKPRTTVFNLPRKKCYVLSNGEKYIECDKYNLELHPSYNDWQNLLNSKENFEDDETEILEEFDYEV